MDNIYLVIGILFVLLIMSYFSSEHSKKKSKKAAPVKKDVNVKEHIEPKIGNVEELVPTTTTKLHRSTAKLNELLKDKAKQAQFKDDMKVLRGTMTEDEYNQKWANREAS